MENAIKRFREEHGLTQKAMSDMYGININTIQNWEQGRSKCPEYIFELLRMDQFHRKMEKKHEEQTQEFLDNIQQLSDEVEYWYRQMKIYEKMYRELLEVVHPKE